jgi:regulation of enolase protein 1 (concanavalin A-like superfamily)
MAARPWSSAGLQGVVVCAAVYVFVSSWGSVSSRAQTSLPSPWVSADVGAPSIAGNAVFNQGVFTISGSGADIWGTSDQFQFVYQQIVGDIDFVVRVDSFAAVQTWSKVGAMIRADLSPGSPNAFALVSGSYGITFQTRVQQNGATDLTSGENAVAPRWVRLVRKGTTFTGYSSSDGTTWQTIASATIAMSSAAYVGLAIASHDPATLARADVSNVGVTPLSVPSEQQSLDIGSPAVGGATTYDNGVYTITAGGADIWGSSDQFRFVYQQVTGDMEVVAHVASLKQVHPWTKAGVMIRESLSAASRNAMALISSGKGYSFQWRLDTGGLTAYSPNGVGAVPAWVRLVRSGQTIQAFNSADGSAWTPIGAQAVAMASSVYVGLAVASHSTSQATQAVVDQFRITPAGAPPNQPPVVSLTAPASGAQYTAPATITVGANASDPENRLARVEFYANAARISTVTAAPYSTTWSGVAAGTYSLTAVAFDSDGGSATSPAVTVDVQSAPSSNQPPTVSLTAPANGAQFTAPATITVSANASDPENRLARVEFYANTTRIGTVTGAPYSMTWSGVSAGSYSLTAVAFDSDGGSATSAAASITVQALLAGNQPPTVTLTAPTNGSSFVAPASVTISANASDPENRLLRVDFYVNYALLGSGSSAPYSVTWSASSPGAYTLQAFAFDADGNLGSSATATVTVTTGTSTLRNVTFLASADHATLVNSYQVDIFVSGADPATATPVASSNIGKPSPDPSTNLITVDQLSLFDALTPGSYILTVSALGDGGASRSSPPIPFTR